jgi:hypothetical protein
MRTLLLFPADSLIRDVYFCTITLATLGLHANSFTVLRDLTIAVTACLPGPHETPCEMTQNYHSPVPKLFDFCHTKHQNESRKHGMFADHL